jgi:hypothetical protein
MTSKAQQLVSELLTVFTPSEVAQLVDAQAAERAAADRRKAAELSAMLEDRAVADRRATIERQRAAVAALRDREQAQRRAVAAREAVTAARAAYLASAAELNASVEAHRRAHELAGGLVDRAPGEAFPWERPASWQERSDPVTLAQLQRAR